MNTNKDMSTLNNPTDCKQSDSVSTNSKLIVNKSNESVQSDSKSVKKKSRKSCKKKKRDKRPRSLSDSEINDSSNKTRRLSNYNLSKLNNLNRQYSIESNDSNSSISSLDSEECPDTILRYEINNMGQDAINNYRNGSNFSTDNVDGWASTCAVKVKLTEAENYDVIAFKSTRSNLIIHFGLFLKPTQMLHIEEGGVSVVETLSDYWVKRIHSLYRHESMVQ